MKPLFDPSLISLDNAAEDAWLELRCERARELFIATQMQESGRTRGEVEAIVNEFFPPPETESEADRKFIESMANIVAANFLMPKKKRFSWEGLFAVLAVAAFVMWLAYQAAEGF